jgi:Na+-driven multidrug efflux pump
VLGVAASPIIAIQLVEHFQAAGKLKKALMLTLSKQGFFLIPLVLILPNFSVFLSGLPSLLPMCCQQY